MEKNANKKKTAFTMLFTFAIVAMSHAQSDVTTNDSLELTLEKCLAYALDNNYTRQSVRLDEEIDLASWEQSRLNRLPGVSAGASEGFSESRSSGTNWSGNYDVSADVTLFQGGQITQEIRQNKLLYEQTQLKTRQYDNELTVQVLQSFLAALGNEELLKYQESILETSEKQMNEGKVRFGAGQILESDYLLLEAQYAGDLHNVTGTRISLETSLVALKNLMSMQLDAPVKLVYPDDAVMESMLSMPSRHAVVARGLETMPDIRIGDYNVDIAETGLKISRASLYPTLSMSGGVGTGHSPDFRNFGTQLADRFGPQAGISLSVPIFNGNAARTRVRQSGIALQQAELNRRQSVKDIEQTLISEYGNVLSSASAYRSSEIRQHAQLSSFEAYTAMFNAGAITTVELLQQQNNYISAMNDYIQSKYTFMLQRKVLDVYMGEPIKM